MAIDYSVTHGRQQVNVNEKGHFVQSRKNSCDVIFITVNHIDPYKCRE